MPICTCAVDPFGTWQTTGSEVQPERFSSLSASSGLGSSRPLRGAWIRGSRIDGRSPSLERQTYHAGALWKYVDLGCLADADAGVERYRGRMPCGVVGMLWGGVRVILVLHDS